MTATETDTTVEVCRMDFTHVARIAGQYWPATVLKDGGTLVDLRLFDDAQKLTFQPDKLPALPPELVAGAATSNPPGFILLRN